VEEKRCGGHNGGRGGTEEKRRTPTRGRIMVGSEKKRKRSKGGICELRSTKGNRRTFFTSRNRIQ